MKVGDLTDKGRIVWMDDISEHVPDPLVKLKGYGAIKHRLSDLTKIDDPNPPKFSDEDIEHINEEVGKFNKLLIKFFGDKASLECRTKLSTEVELIINKQNNITNEN